MASSEKQPWGRSLAAFFPCCHKESNQPEIRMINEKPPQQPDQPAPPPQELDAMFAELVEELELSGEHRQAMFALPAEKKWQIYCSKKAVRKRRTSAGRFLQRTPTQTLLLNLF
uniref:Formin GTPase-binding domain-containing protein n=1 Tax=Oryzias melastigma TaxID=30732 RepID=A0A3B3CV23_ORYME